MNYRTVNNYTKQKMIEIINREFIGKAVNTEDYSQCYYKSPDGKKCAIGCFITEDRYTESFENLSAETLLNNFSIGFLMPLEENGLMQFQYYHDNLDNEVSPEEQKQLLIEWIEKNVI